ncbi:MerR family transcriptional regulator [Solibacillus sp. FSL H8-0538]|uniref:MerR family transcriptional regulator n=1 Tax=Solibacillus sp. FSL H8-0538 TaxID=2921400 RepID=UPI0030FC7D78
MGELANQSAVTKRTIDHYTNLGLLTVERSVSNYRYYDKEMIERIHWIEKLKKTGKSLDEIRALLQVETLVEEEIDIQEIRLQMRKLEKDVVTLMGQMDEKQIQQMKKKVSPESVALIQSLLLLVP